MQQESDQEKKLEELLSSMRETARENRESLESRYELGRVAEREEAEEREPATMPGSGSFYFRTVLCLLIFLGSSFFTKGEPVCFRPFPGRAPGNHKFGSAPSGNDRRYEKVRKKENEETAGAGSFGLLPPLFRPFHGGGKERMEKRVRRLRLLCEGNQGEGIEGDRFRYAVVSRKKTVPF